MQETEKKTPLINLYKGDCVDVFKTLPENSIDAIVTDPPYGIRFMNKKWDYEIPSVKIWEEAFRLLKPGAYILVACGTRTYHRTVSNIEDAGFQIRDCIVWAYGSGFPKSLNISKDIDRQLGCEREVVGKATRHGGGNSQIIKGDYNSPITAPSSPEAITYDGYGTALKPAIELWCLAMKPISEKNIAQNVLKWGTGGINIDSCRIPTKDSLSGGNVSGQYKAYDGWDRPWRHDAEHLKIIKEIAKEKIKLAEELGRWPANLIIENSDEVKELFPITKSGKMNQHVNGGQYNIFGKQYPRHVKTHGDSGSASRFFKLIPNDTSRENCIQFSKLKRHFSYGEESDLSAARFFASFSLHDDKRLIYCSKASPKERNEGLNELPAENNMRVNAPRSNEQEKFQTKHRNNHPTVKPISLMRYLCRLVTPPEGIILDPFMGSGSTGVAAFMEDFNFIGIEINPEYFIISKKRIEYYKTGKAA